MIDLFTDRGDPVPEKYTHVWIMSKQACTPDWIKVDEIISDLAHALAELKELKKPKKIKGSK